MFGGDDIEAWKVSRLATTLPQYGDSAVPASRYVLRARANDMRKEVVMRRLAPSHRSCGWLKQALSTRVPASPILPMGHTYDCLPGEDPRNLIG